MIPRRLQAKLYRLSCAGLLCAALASAHAAPASNAPTSTTLTCNYPMWNNPGVSDRISNTGTSVKVDIGVNRNLGGVGAELTLTNRANPNPVNILEARSAGGAGWQFTSFLHTYDGNQLIFNQAAGNSIGSQWGYAQSFVNGGSYLNATNWAPNYSDTFNGVGQSPCAPTARTVVFDDGALDIGTGLFSSAYGSGISVTHAYSLRSRVNQYWQMYMPLHALYLNRAIARAGSMRFYIIGNTGWRYGPVYPFNDFTLPSTYASSGPDGLGNTSWQITTSASRVVMVWNIWGQDVGISIPLVNGGTLRLAKTIYCTNPASDSCGSIDWQTNSRWVPNASFPAGSVRQYSYTYYFGTLQQLAAVGLGL